MPVPRKDYNLAVTMYEDGLSIADVAKHYGVTRQSMYKILKRRGVKFRSRLKYGTDNHFFRGGGLLNLRGSNMLTDDERKRAADMYRGGLSIVGVAKRMNTSPETMRTVLKYEGVNLREQRREGGENHFYRGGSTADAHVHNMLEYAIRKGRIERKYTCEICGYSGTFKDGRSAIQAHHCDYNKPYDVMWLCQKCHHEWHVAHKAIPKKEVETDETTDAS